MRRAALLAVKERRQVNRVSAVPTSLGAFLLFAVSWSQLGYAASPRDACGLVTPAQVTAVLGTSVGSGEHLFPSNTTLCSYGGSGAAKGAMVAIVKLSLFEHEKTPMPGIKEESATGIGDEAHYMTTPGFGTGLSVKKGSFAFKVRVFGFTPEQVKQKEKTLALNALAKL